MPVVCPFSYRWDNECRNARCARFTAGYVYGLLDARIDDIFYVGSTVQRPGVRYSDHMGASRTENFREAWILAILADGSLPVFLQLAQVQTECENELKAVENEIADDLRSMGHTAKCDFTGPSLARRMCALDRWSEVNWELKEHAIAEHLDRVNEQARILRWLREEVRS